MGIARALLRTPAQLVYDELGDIGAWKVDTHYLVHKRSGVKLWTSNGRFFFRPYDPEENLFNVVEKFILWPRASRVCRLQRAGNFIARLTRMEEGDG